MWAGKRTICGTVPTSTYCAFVPFVMPLSCPRRAILEGGAPLTECAAHILEMFGQQPACPDQADAVRCILNIENDVVVSETVLEVLRCMGSGAFLGAMACKK